MTWGNKSNYNTTYLDEATDSPADARPQLKNAVDEAFTFGGCEKVRKVIIYRRTNFFRYIIIFVGVFG